MIADLLDNLSPEVLNRSRTLDLNIRSVNAHDAIDALLKKTVLKGGKRLRPLLTYLMADLFAVDFELITPYARATELVHAASLAHDDVVDNATMRRGAPSINILASNKKAVLAGDYLLSSVIVDLTHAGHLELVREMSLVIKDLSEGEWLQLDLIGTKNYTRDLIREVAVKKTSSVMSYCAVAPALLSGADPKTVELCREFGKCLGLAFQLIDDTLDYSGDSQKDRELDLQNGIVNAVVYEWLDSSQALLKSFKEGKDLVTLAEGHTFSPHVETIGTEAKGHLETAAQILAQLEGILAYTQNATALKPKVQALELVMSYIGLRQH